MTISLRNLFSRHGIAQAAGRSESEIISLRNALANHVDGFASGLREVANRLVEPADGNGYARGCNAPTQIISQDLSHVIPSWVTAHAEATRTVEGVLAKSHITHTDFPLRPWHIYYDWNLFVEVDEQYSYLLSREHGKVMECEWDTSSFPSWAWPQAGNRVWMVGRWIYDCAHPEEFHPGAGTHQTEIHPPKAIASFRMKAVQFEGNSGPTRANSAVVFVGRAGGYIRQPINDRDYAFDLYLPPKPYEGAEVRWKIDAMTGTLPVQPSITPFPSNEPCLLRVVIPLNGVLPHPETYGVTISAGWSDPRQTESKKIERLRVKISTLLIDEFHDTTRDEWHVYIGVNGHWQIFDHLGDGIENLNVSVDLDLHSDDTIFITACGFEEDLMHDYIGRDSGYSWEEISSRNLTQGRREEIERDLITQLAASLGDQNDKIGYLSVRHRSTDRGVFTRSPQDQADYRLIYAIEERPGA